MDNTFQVAFITRDGNAENAPLEYLWKLIESYEVDIFEVSLSRITDDFIAYMKSGSITLEEQSDFVFMAARLIYYKSRLLLPNPGFEEDEENDFLPLELVEQLLEYKRFQAAAEKLSALEAATQFSFPREQTWSQYEEDLDFLEVDLISFLKAFRGFLEREQKKRPLKIEEEEVTVQEMMLYWDSLFDQKGSQLSFFAELGTFSRMRIVASFLAVLELARLKRCFLTQDAQYTDILLMEIPENRKETVYV